MTAKSMHRVRAEKGSARPGNGALPPAYLRLLERFRLRPLTTDAELDEAVVVVDYLLGRKEPLRPEEDEYLGVLSDLIERYEDEQVPIPDASAAEVLRFLIEQRGVTQQQVTRETGIAGSTFSAVLHGQRPLTRRHLERLAAYFDVAPAVFLSGNE